MEIKLFTGLIDTLRKIACDLKAIVNQLKAERETIRGTLDETFRLINTTFNMVIIRLGDIQLHKSDDDFLREDARQGKLYDCLHDWTLNLQIKHFAHRGRALCWPIRFCVSLVFKRERNLAVNRTVKIKEHALATLQAKDAIDTL